MFVGSSARTKVIVMMHIGNVSGHSTARKSGNLSHELENAAIAKVRKSGIWFEDMAMASIQATVSQEKHFKVPTLPSRSSVHTHKAKKAPLGASRRQEGENIFSLWMPSSEFLHERYMTEMLVYEFGVTTIVAKNMFRSS